LSICGTESDILSFIIYKKYVLETINFELLFSFQYFPPSRSVEYSSTAGLSPCPGPVLMSAYKCDVKTTIKLSSSDSGEKK
jgi:hypothetical protein